MQAKYKQPRATKMWDLTIWILFFFIYCMCCSLFSWHFPRVFAVWLKFGSCELIDGVDACQAAENCHIFKHQMVVLDILHDIYYICTLHPSWSISKLEERTIFHASTVPPLWMASRSEKLWRCSPTCGPHCCGAIPKAILEQEKRDLRQQASNQESSTSNQVYICIYRW